MAAAAAVSLGGSLHQRRSRLAYRMICVVAHPGRGGGHYSGSRTSNPVLTRVRPQRGFNAGESRAGVLSAVDLRARV